ncbi:LacI family DNA-binding transcriptional regulator [Jannaschia sp. W003]|uniref:LacI family DNA-binding transcriptional regulator n=1 Tax=Jannaschia sp. W003 TaxID=2867012 RepID=UPI0021A4FE44|nr:LacI family DNA-binding transcriptional regulator [Jannaschia sp. W003]UWQ23131.1 LacI family DNA-binding transcriptional regulator [Jannaschia sp. W003]
MPRKPTLGTVAKEAGVSIPTVSQVMRGTGRISEETRAKVLRAAAALHYLPNSQAAAMRSGERREIGFVLNRLGNPFNAEVVSGAVDLLEAEGYLVSLLDGQDDPDKQFRQIEAFIRHGRGGLMWVPAVGTPPRTLDLLAAHDVPTVTFLRPAGGRFDYVGIRNAEATGAATRHLAALGHRRIAYLGGTDMTYVREQRIAGYGAAMRDGALGEPVIWPSPDGRRAGMEAMAALRAAHPGVTAVVCNGDMVALGACIALAREGLVPGRAVSVVGFDDIEDAALAIPPLTTMATAPARLGRRLARVLLGRIGDPEGPPSVTEVAATLAVRATTGPPV